MIPQKWVSVVGSAKIAPSERELPYQLGQLIAQRGYGVICGGRGGVMEAVCQGAKASGGVTLGILPSLRREEANPYVDIVIPSGLGEGRNLLVALSGHGVIAVYGGLGTLTEVAFALKHGRPVAFLNQWPEDFFSSLGYSPYRATTAQEALAWLEGQWEKGVL